MKRYGLYIETVNDETFEVIWRQLEDVCSAECIDDCLEKTDWENYKLEANEQLCIDEMDEEGFLLEEYYPLLYSDIEDNAKR